MENYQIIDPRSHLQRLPILFPRLSGTSVQREALRTKRTSLQHSTVPGCGDDGSSLGEPPQFASFAAAVLMVLDACSLATNPSLFEGGHEAPARS